MKKILWLASWYPNKISPLNGDFVQRHAEALSGYEPLEIIFVVKDDTGTITNGVIIERFTRGNLAETIAYYHPCKTNIKALDRLISLITYFNVLRKLVNAFIKTNGVPKLVHVHVAMWAGVMAIFLKKKYKVPYFVTEHWTGYHKNAIENINNKGWLFKVMCLKVLKQAEMLLPDSHHLGETINTNITPVKFRHVSNTVNTDHFNISGYAGSSFRFIHVSAMSPQKNVSGLLRAFAKLLVHCKDCRLIMAGPAPGMLKKQANDMELQANIDWFGAITNQEVAGMMGQSSALVMFSRYENQPCVILEALCSGLPVISTNVGGIPEVIDADNGILINSEDEAGLLMAMTEMIKKYGRYNKIQISELATAKYNYEAIGKLMFDLYQPYLK